MARVASQLSDVLNAARDQIVAAGVCTLDQTSLNLDPNDLMGTGTQTSPLVALSFGAEDQFPGTIHCEIDNDDTPATGGELTCAIWYRVALDQPSRDDQALTNSSLGSVKILARKVLRALNNKSLYNADGDEITWRTINFIGFANRGRWKQDQNWRRLDVRFDVVFQMNPVAA